MKNLNYNMLSCPNCCNLLVDELAEYEMNKQIKTVACSNKGCDFRGYRHGFILLTNKEIQNFNKSNNANTFTHVERNSINA